MNNKHVTVLRDGRKLKQFICKTCDFSKRSLVFHGVPYKNSHSGTLTVNYFGNLYYEIDHLQREAIVIPDEPGIQILITW